MYRGNGSILCVNCGVDILYIRVFGILGVFNVGK